jgi:hypothetical protein
MTPTLYAKLSAQVTRQQPELAALDADIAAAQPAIDSAQAWHDSCTAAHASAQAALDADSARPDDAPEDWTEPDTSAQQAAVAATAATLETARADLAALTGARDELVMRAEAIRAAIAQCQAEMQASGLALTQGEIDAILSAPKVPASITPAQGEEQLRREGLLDTVLTYIAGLPQTDPMSIAYRRALSWDRTSPSLIGMLQMLGKSDADADAFFVASSQIRL